MCESAIMAGTTIDIRIGTQVITTIAEGSTATGIIATAVGIIIEEVTTATQVLGARRFEDHMETLSSKVKDCG